MTSGDELPPTLPGGLESEAPSSTGGVAAEGVAAEGGRFADSDLDAIESLGRFRIERFLGAGGMGKVFRAFDQKLERAVALKLLTVPDATASRRLLAEARAQARVDHPNVCQIYDAGEVRGRRFIVMQLVEGRTLSKLAPELALEQKIAVVRDVCEGVQAAHRIGLVHRDLKSSNVLVAESDAGWHPYVVDFGLARPVGEPGATLTAAAAGTPWYMSPEQVAGGAIDRRSDVYALGVLLYRMLAGRYPIDGSSEIDVLMKVLTEDPEPLRKGAPGLPADLETLVMTCLERDPARRYDSARALADDLGRWLAGEPIAARPASWGYRLGKKVRKHKTIVALGAAAALALAAVGGYALTERLRAAERTRLAQRFGAETERLEWLLRAAYELPLHDVSPARAQVRERLTELERVVAGLDRDLEGPGRAAIGRGWLALDDEERALEHLERAWAAGYREPDAAYARGLALARGLERAVEAARRSGGPAEREHALAEARRRFQRPALEALAAAGGALAAPAEFVTGLLAFLEERFEPALAAARAADRRHPWFYEAKLLEGSIERAGAERQNEPAARERAFAAARLALDEAARRGESDPRAYERQCSLGFDLVAEAITGRGEGIDAAHAAALAACDRALVADPGFRPARRTRLAGIAGHLSHRLDQGDDPEAGLAAAIADARALVEEDRRDAEAQLTLARLLQVEAKRLRFGGGDPRPPLRAAVAGLEAARAAGVDDWRAARELGKAHADLAVQADERGADPETDRAAAIAALERAATLAPDLFSVHFDLGRIWSDRAASRQLRGADVTAEEERAIAAYLRALALRPDYPQAENSLGVVFLNRGQAATDRGEVARPALEEAIRHFERAHEIQPRYANSRFNLGLAHRALADLEAKAGRDPWPALERADRAFRQGLELNPGIFYAYLEMARIHTQGADWELEQGRSPAKPLAEAHRLVDRALADAPDDYMALFVKGEAEVIAARWERRQGRPGDAAAERARGWLLRAERANPESLSTLQLIAALELDRAEALAAAGRPATAEVARARGYVERAARIHPGLPSIERLRARLSALESTALATRAPAAR